MKDGYTIAHKGLLVWTPIPPPADVARIRVFFVAIEGWFTVVAGGCFLVTDAVAVVSLPSPPAAALPPPLRPSHEQQQQQSTPYEK